MVDCGWLETTVTPVNLSEVAFGSKALAEVRQVYNSRPLVHLARSTPSGGRALHRFLRTLLHRYAVYLPPSSPGAEAGGRQRQNPVSFDRLTDRVVEQVLTKGCVVGGLPEIDVPIDEVMDVDSSDEMMPEDSEARLLVAMKDRYGSSTFPDRPFRIPHSTSPRDGQGTLVIPGLILERAAEVLFDSTLSEEAESIPQAVLSTLLKVSKASRQPKFVSD